MERGKYKEFKIPISLVMLAITLFLFVLLVMYFFNLTILPLSFQSFLTSLGGWSYYIFILSLAGFLYFAYLLAVTVSERRKFEELIYSDSKATFVKNERDLDVISAKLGPSFRKRYEEKKSQLRIR
ncbi:MAG: DUF3198 domain-containing protein [Candidatus Thermoplasmatota archaeon]|nr:DUF3198 domain-containing protein [Candidatus Thermoplasmatota archaeon]